MPSLIDHAPRFWEHFVAEAIAQPSQHRARYQALSTLLPHVGAATILQVHSEQAYSHSQPDSTIYLSTFVFPTIYVIYILISTLIIS